MFLALFLLMIYSLLLILTLFCNMEIVLDKMQIWTIVLLEFKMSFHSTETTHDINDAKLAQGLLTSWQYSGGAGDLVVSAGLSHHRCLNQNNSFICE